MNGPQERFCLLMSRLPRAQHARDVQAGQPEAVEVTRQAWLLAQVDSTPGQWRRLEEAVSAYLRTLPCEVAGPGGAQ
jgi:hypothetical protein